MKLINLIKKGIIVPGKMMLVCNIERRSRGRGKPHHRVSLCSDLNKGVRKIYLKSSIAHERLVYIEFC